jgi:hypothetical protein
MKIIKKKKKKATLMLREDCRVAGKAQSHPNSQRLKPRRDRD